MQKAIEVGTFDQKTHAKITLAAAHQHSIGASSPCKARNHAAAVLVAGAVQGVVASMQRRGAAAPAPAVEFVTIL